jgi:hypothetical protein
MPAYTPKSQTVAAKQFNLYASDTKHEHVVNCMGGGYHWGELNPLVELPKGVQAFGPSTLAVKDPITNTLTELHDKDWIVHTEHGNVLVIPDALFNQLYNKL